MINVESDIIYAIIVYVIFAILIGYFVPTLAPLADVFAALVAGIYVGRGDSTMQGITKGATVGVIGGLIIGFLGIYVHNIAGIPITTPTVVFLLPVEGFTNVLYSPLVLGIIGVIYGAIGGLLGSIKRLKSILLFFTLFALFLLYGAVDNVVWNWGTPDWTWQMSVNHVLTNRIDIAVAIAFALFVTFLAYFFEIEK